MKGLVLMLKLGQKNGASHTQDKVEENKIPAICIEPIGGGEFIWISFNEVEGFSDIINIITEVLGPSSLDDFIVSCTEHIPDQISKGRSSVYRYMEVIDTYKSNDHEDWKKLCAYLSLGYGFKFLSTAMEEAVDTFQTSYTQRKVDDDCGWLMDRVGEERALFCYTIELVYEDEYFVDIPEGRRHLLDLDKCHQYIQQDYLAAQYGDEYFIFYVGQ
jgi:hypothetical protein